MLLGRLGLVTRNLALKVVNKSIKNGAYRYKIGNSEWKKLNNFEVTLEEGV